MKRFVFFTILAGFIGCGKSSGPDQSATPFYSEKYRPQYHLSPKENWTNDPNGLVYYEGEYHLFYQYNPYGKTWGHMSWGHAVSKDLLHWEHLPIAIPEYVAGGDSTMVFSGTVVVDPNTSGLCTGKDCMVAVYTSHVHKNGEGLRQHQSLAYSNDRGRTWTRYDKNPVLDIQRKDFRDPKIFWHRPTKKWVMALVIPDLFKVRFYGSGNLLDWKQLSEFGGMGDTTRIWECPDLYELALESDTTRKNWVLSLSGSHPRGPEFVGMQYFVGQFDGISFTPDDTRQIPLYVDQGKDFYAGIVFNHLSDRTVMVGWVNNWTYANKVPTYPWRGQFSLPRELGLRRSDNGLRLIQRPIPETTVLRKELTDSLLNFSGSHVLDGARMEIMTELDALKPFAIHIRGGENETTFIGLEPGLLTVDRTESGNVAFSASFPGTEPVRIGSVDGKVKLHIFIDESIVEIFVNDGEASVTELIFPTSEKRTLSFEGEVLVWKVWTMKTIWIQ